MMFQECLGWKTYEYLKNLYYEQIHALMYSIYGNINLLSVLIVIDF